MLSSWTSLINQFQNNVTAWLRNCNFHFFADDTVLYASAHSINTSPINQQLSFNCIQKHICDLKRVQKCAKTKWMLFSSARIIFYDGAEIHSVIT